MNDDLEGVRRELIGALQAAGADGAKATTVAREIEGLAAHYCAWFGASDTDDIALPMHAGLCRWHTALTELRARIAEAEQAIQADPVNADSLGLALIQARVGHESWSAFLTRLEELIVASRLGRKPRMGEDRATRHLFMRAAALWRDATGKLPARTKATVADSPLLDALTAFAAGHADARAALSDDKYFRAIQVLAEQSKP
jgi:hypothetical protein